MDWAAYEQREREERAAAKGKLLSAELLTKLKGLGVGAVVVKGGHPE